MKILLYLLLMLISTIGHTQDLDIETLRGLNGVEVLIETISEEAEKDGFSELAIQTDVELKLRMAGITVYESLEESIADSSYANLYVHVGFMKTDKGIYVYCVDVELRQVVLLMRDNSIISYTASTWNAVKEIGIVGASNITQIRDSVKDQVDQFINAYLTANPKE